MLLRNFASAFRTFHPIQSSPKSRL
ncbi:unnamed protein product [Larinioides sclopetarius]|uniref:Uncharacterized protein n=1 Tax=Larinioides sclopetarius TaxID=280406 RepID=A0AAV1Z3C2_9ARAC